MKNASRMAVGPQYICQFKCIFELVITLSRLRGIFTHLRNTLSKINLPDQFRKSEIIIGDCDCDCHIVQRLISKIMPGQSARQISIHLLFNDWNIEEMNKLPSCSSNEYLLISH